MILLALALAMLAPLFEAAAPSPSPALHQFHSLQTLDSSSSSSSSSSTGTNHDVSLFGLTFNLDFTGGTALEGIIAIVLIMVGLLLVFVGARLIKLSVWVVSVLLVGGILFYIIYTQTGNALAAFLTGLLVGLSLACLVFCVWRVALLVMGGVTGFILWLGFKTLFPNAITNDGGLYVLCAVIILACAIVALFFENFLLVIITAIIGSFLFAQGLNHWFSNDYDFNTFRAVWGSGGCSAGGCYGIAFAFFALAVVGVAVQMKWTRHLWPESKDSNSACPCIPFCPI